MKSNQHVLSIWTRFVVFHDSADHNVSITVDDQPIFDKTFSPGIKHHVKVDDVFDFKQSGHKKIKIEWQSDHETQNKYMIIDKWVINKQHLPVFRCMYIPDDNDYICNIKLNGTLEEKQKLRKKIILHGNMFGWFGKIIWDFVLGNGLEVGKTLLTNNPEQIAGVYNKKIYLDDKEARQYDRFQRKN